MNCLSDLWMVEFVVEFLKLARRKTKVTPFLFWFRKLVELLDIGIRLSFYTLISQSKATGMLDWYTAHYDAIMSHGWAASVWNDGGEHLIFDYKTGAWTTDILQALGRTTASLEKDVLV